MVKTFKVYLGSTVEPFLNGSHANVPSSWESTAGSSSHMAIPRSSNGTRKRHTNSQSGSHEDTPPSISPQSSSATNRSALSVSPNCHSPPPCYELIKYSCVHCQTNLARHEDLISKSFQGGQGRAYLFQNVVNVKCGRVEERALLTGQHSVCDISCQCCKTVLGWKYEHAYEPSQKYKEGKYIVELVHLMKDNCWEVSSSAEERNAARCISPVSSARNSGVFEWDKL
jgi:hypothetical protein